MSRNKTQIFNTYFQRGKVKNIKFSNTQNASPKQIILIWTSLKFLVLSWSQIITPLHNKTHHFTWFDNTDAILILDAIGSDELALHELLSGYHYVVLNA